MPTLMENENPQRVLKISNIKVHGLHLSESRWFKRRKRVFVRISVNEEEKQSMVTPRGADPASWDNVFYFVFKKASILKVEVVVAHKWARLAEVVASASSSVYVLLENVCGEVISLKSDQQGAKFGAVTIEFECEVTNSEANFDISKSTLKQLIPVVDDAVIQSKKLPHGVDVVVEASVTLDDNLTDLSDKVNIWNSLLDRIGLFAKLVDGISEIHPYAKMAWSILSLAAKAVNAQKLRDERVDHLVEVILDLYSFIQQAESLSDIIGVKSVVVTIVQQTIECAYFIRDYLKDASVWKRLVTNLVSEVDYRIQKYEDKLRELKDAFRLRTAAHSSITVLRMLHHADSTAFEFVLDDMLYAFGARYNIEKRCLDGTRISILDDIGAWINKTAPDDNINESRVLVLFGVAGSGKSAIAHTIARRFDYLGRLGSSYCFDRSRQVQLHPGNFFSTIARDLADFDPQRKQALWNIVKDDRSLRRTQVVKEQFEKFILKPSKDVQDVGPILVVVDALDESGNVSERKSLVSVLSERVSELPSNFKVLITCRPESDLVKAFLDNPLVNCVSMDDINPTSTRSDISTYIKHELEECSELEVRWPKQEWLETLVDRSESLFQWASTACLFIRMNDEGGWNPVEQMEILLTPTSNDANLDRLDQLYFRILKSIFPSDNPTRTKRFRSVLGEVIGVVEPLPISALKSLREDEGRLDVVNLLLRPLGSLLSGVLRQDVPVRSLHTSFRDFLTNESRSREFYVNPDDAQRPLFEGCMRIMSSGLRFNICQLETSHLFNSDVQDLHSRVQNFIPPQLSYASCYWAHHLKHLQNVETVQRSVLTFLEQYFLFWLEALALLKRIGDATYPLSMVHTWSKSTDLSELASDGLNFVSAFGSVASESSPHLYLSALPSTPINSKIFQLYHGRFSRLLKFKEGKQLDWPALRRVEDGHNDRIFSLIPVSGEDQVLSVSMDGSLRRWDLLTGQLRQSVSLENGHNKLTAASFSRDAKKLATTSKSNTLCVWDCQTGELCCGPSDHYEKAIYSLAFSSDGDLLATASMDHTCRIYRCDSVQFTLIGICDQSGPVLTVTFSHSGQMVGSGGFDEAIHLWTPSDEKLNIKRLIHHDLDVLSLTFTQRDEQVISGHASGSVRVWDILTGELLHGPFRVHTQAVYCLGLGMFKDREVVLVGSGDASVSVFDPLTETLLQRPFERHQASVSCIAYHPAGCYLSGSSDTNIHIWNMYSSPQEGNPTGIEHSYRFRSAALSTDGQTIALGSQDGSLSLWSVSTGKMLVSSSATANYTWVYKVAFSPSGEYLSTASAGMAQVFLWKVNTDGQLSLLFDLKEHGHSVAALCFSPNGQHFVSGTYDGEVILWDLQGVKRKFWSTDAQEKVISSIAWPSSLNQIAVAFQHGRIAFLSVEALNLQRVFDLPKGKQCTSIIFSSDSEAFACGCQDSTLGIWSIETWDLLWLSTTGNGGITSLSFSRDSTLLAWSTRSGAIQVWDIINQKLSCQLNDDSNAIHTVAFNPDGLTLISAGITSIRSWDLSTIWEARDSDVFGDSSIVSENGWVKGKDFELLFWVPPIYRSGLWRPSNKLVIAQRRTRLDFGEFIHGTGWAGCGAKV